MSGEKMPHELDVLAWNVAGGLGRPETARQIFRIVDRLQPDVAYFCEAFHTGDAEFSTLATSREDFVNRGYEVADTPYRIAGRRDDDRGMMMASRLGRVGIADLRSRAALYADMTDEQGDLELRVLGVHIDDRTGLARRRQVTRARRYGADAIIGGIHDTGNNIGPFGAVWPSAAPRVRRNPYYEPKSHSNLTSAILSGSVRSMRTAVSGGKAWAALDTAGYISADPGRRPTFCGWFRLSQLDYILVRDNLQVTRFAVLDPIAVSDHRGVWARLAITGY